jgi:signal transduction histidine kinase
LAAAALAGSIVIMAHGGFFDSHEGTRALDAAAVTLIAVSTLPLLLWRRSPLGAFVVTATANVILAAVVYPIGLPLGPAVALYLLAASRDDTTPPLATILATVVAALIAYAVAAAITEHTFPGTELLHTTLVWSVAWFAGERTRLRREQIAELKRDAQRARQLAAAEERARIARDLHDSAGHAINVIAVRAGAARLRHRDDPDRTLRALEDIEELARRTVDDIDHIVGALRDRTPEHSIAAPPTLASLNTLITQHGSTGLDIAFDTTGTPRPLNTAVDQAAYRIVQEALTNASRHGAGAAHISVCFNDTVLKLQVANPIGPQTPRRTNGVGLVGMRERAELLGGKLTIEQNHETYRVTARIPYEAERT